MKKRRWFTAIFFVLLAAGCAEINEALVISEDGSGTYSTKMDMSQLIEMMQSFGGEEMNKEGLDKVIDTVISLNSYTDTTKDYSPEQRKILSKGTMHMQMNIKEKVFKIDTDIPFSSYNDLQVLLSSSGSSSSMNSVMKKLFDKGGAENTDQPDSPKDPGLDQINTIFDVVAKNGMLSKKVNKEKFKLLMERPEMAQMSQVSNAGIEVLYSTVIKLPRPVISSDNPLIKLSDDKKTVTIKYNYLELFENPDKFSYTITY